MDKHTICLLNDSFPPIIDGVANAVVNYAENIEKHHGGHARRAGRGRQRLSVSGGALPEHRHAPARRLRRGLSVFAGDGAARARGEGRAAAHALPHRLGDPRALAARGGGRAAGADLPHEVRHRHCQGGEEQAFAGERHSCPCAERERLRRGVGGEPRRGRESALARLRGRVHCDGEWRGRAARARERRGGRRCDSGL